MKGLKFVFFITVLFSVRVAIAQTHPPQPPRQPPLYDGGYYLPQVPDHVSGPVFVNEQIPVDRKNISVDIKKNKIWWGGKIFSWVVDLNMRYHGHAGGRNPKIFVSQNTVNLVNNNEPNKNFREDLKRQNKNTNTRKEVRKNKHSKKRHKGR